MKNYEICAACASRLNAGDIENSIKAIQEAAILAEREKKEEEAKLSKYIEYGLSILYSTQSNLQIYL